jgi:hypothetical protein
MPTGRFSARQIAAARANLEKARRARGAKTSSGSRPLTLAQRIMGRVRRIGNSISRRATAAGTAVRGAVSSAMQPIAARNQRRAATAAARSYTTGLRKTGRGGPSPF